MISNEIECCNFWKINPRLSDGTLNRLNIRVAMQKMAECGVKDKVIIHSKEISFVLDVESGSLTEVPSLKIPKEEIKGSVGAGDAFCAGCLYGLYHDYGDKQLLEFASAAAACNLFEANSVDGMRTKNEIMNIAQKDERAAL